MAIIVNPAHPLDITTRLREWLDGKWPKDRLLDDDLQDALAEIQRLRDRLGDTNVHLATYDCTTAASLPEGKKK